ncbi:AAA family ATPase [Erysipelothrix rhusiopathiae]|nr:AAA family ATPase [Erysipelothrix rhusiopathiae]
MAFHIAKITATGTSKPPATITFNKGLNIICGVSDSGKTCVLKCIQFAMGVIKKPFEIEQTGYDSVSLDIMTIEGSIRLSRTVGRNIVNVVTEIASIDGGDYDIEYKKDGNKNPVLNELWLKLIGIEKLPMIIKNQDFARQRLSWKTLLGLFWLKEQDIENPKSVLLPSTPTQNPYFFACLLYLLTGNEYPDMEENDKDEISKAKKEAVRQFVNGRISQMSQKREELQKALSAYGALDVEEEMQKLIDNLSETEAAITAATEESKDLLGTLLDLKEVEAENQVTYSHFQSLKSQYTADIKRLSFIVDGEVHLHSVDKNKKCPFCEGNIQPSERKSYIAASKAELNRIITQLQGLSESEKDVISSLNEVRGKINHLESQRSDIEKLIDTELIPQSNKLREGIQQYRSYVQLQQESTVLQNVSQEWITELQKQENDSSEKLKFKPKEHYPVDFNTRIDEIAYSILVDCKYENLNTVHFNMGTFDLEINGYSKEDSHGKGYWAFINTVVGLTFRQYLQEDAVHKPGLFVVDTPLLGLDQGVDDTAPTSMRTALFQYFIDNQSEGQMIVVENTKDLPELDYEFNGAKVIEFTQGKYESKYKESRYGFLHDVYSN